MSMAGKRASHGKVSAREWDKMGKEEQELEHDASKLVVSDDEDADDASKPAQHRSADEVLKVICHEKDTKGTRAFPGGTLLCLQACVT